MGWEKDLEKAIVNYFKAYPGHTTGQIGQPQSEFQTAIEESGLAKKVTATSGQNLSRAIGDAIQRLTENGHLTHIDPVTGKRKAGWFVA